MENKIDPTASRIPKEAVIKIVALSDNKLPDIQHTIAAQAFLVCDATASGINKDWVFVKEIPLLINRIIDNKSWETLYIAKGVINPCYCSYIQGTDSENFQAFVSANRPYGLGTTVEEIDQILQIDPEIQTKFRKFIFQSSPQSPEPEVKIEGMNYSKLSQPENVLSWFHDPCYDLRNLGTSKIEKDYLETIDEVARRSGAPNFWLADYIWRLESRITKIERSITNIWEQQKSK